MMIHPSLQEKKFWEVLEFLVKLDGRHEVNYILDQLGVEQATLDKVLLFLAEVNVKFERVMLGEREFIITSRIRPKIKFEFDLIDWLKFQAHFPLLSGFKDQPFHQKVAENLAKVEERYKSFDLFQAVKVLGNVGKSLIPTIPKIVTLSDASTRKEQVSEEFSEILEIEGEGLSSIKVKSTIELSITTESCLILRMIGHTDSITVYPHRMVHLDGTLSLVAEDISEKTLIYLPVAKIDCATEKNEPYVPLHSDLEIDDFISGIRAINGNEVRLVLKILNPDQAQELSPLYHFLRKPYVISNPKGDLIWAASIEENEDIYEWLSNLESKVEIMDPTSFKINYLAFCERKLKNSA